MEKIYNNDNIFAKILRKELPSKLIYEDDKMMAFEDINPAAPVHILFIPKLEVVDFADFTAKAEAEFMHHFFTSIAEVAKNKLNLTSYRLVTNLGSDAGQEVPHFHVHLLGGKKLGGLK
jgi:histidine triad (HIT) family protein